MYTLFLNRSDELDYKTFEIQDCKSPTSHDWVLLIRGDSEQ